MSEKNKQMNELKEEQQAFIEICQMPCKDCKLNLIKEVLQEQYKFRIKWSEKAILVDGVERLSSDQVIHLQDQIKFYGKLLAKLDGSTDSLRDGIDYEKEYADVLKPSDGEKELPKCDNGLNHTHGIDVGKLPNDSKPICPDCESDKGVIPLSNGIWHCGDCNTDIEPEAKWNWCSVKDCKLIGTDSQCKNCPDWDKIPDFTYIDGSIDGQKSIKSITMSVIEEFNKGLLGEGMDYLMVKRDDLKKPYIDLITDLDYWINTNRDGISTLYILKDIKSKYKKRLDELEKEE